MLFLRTLLVAASVLYPADASTSPDAEPARQTLAELIDRAAANPQTAKLRQDLIKRADAIIASKDFPRKRYDTLQEVLAHDGLAGYPYDESVFEDLEREESRVLSAADVQAALSIMRDLPLLATAFRLTNEAKYCDAVIVQLHETLTWSPLQRPGFMLFLPESHWAPGEWDANAWLGTGFAVRGIADALEILPQDAISDMLRSRIHHLLNREVLGVMDDFKQRRPWYTTEEGLNTTSNQWVLPLEALVRACVVLGDAAPTEAYEFGVSQLMRTLDDSGPNGEFDEGMRYAAVTLESLIQTGRAMAALRNDRRLIDHPFMQKYPTWWVHHFQPGRMAINAFDCLSASPLPSSGQWERTALSTLALGTQHPTARWALYRLCGGPSQDLVGLLTYGVPLPREGDADAPPLFAEYKRTTRVNWRSSWAGDGSGLWVRGGHDEDFHDHNDRGHVSFTVAGQPLLIEMGTPRYDHRQMRTVFVSGLGHNVLQIGTAGLEHVGKMNNAGYLLAPGWQKDSLPAPITVRDLNESGGDLEVDATACYDGLESWIRRVTWDANKATIKDEVKLAPGAPQVLMFRWHTAATEEVKLTGNDRKFEAAWAGTKLRVFPSPPEVKTEDLWLDHPALLRLSASAPIEVELVRAGDRTLKAETEEDALDDELHSHVCLVVRTREPQENLSLTTEVSLAPNGK